MDERILFTEKLNKFKQDFAELRDNPQDLKVKLDLLKPQIVKLIKKKRTTNANKQVKTLEEMSRKENELPESNNNYMSQYYKTPIKESLQTQQHYQRTEFAFQSDLQNGFIQEDSLLGKRGQVSFEVKRDLELYIPSKFFIVTNSYYKVQQIRM